MGSGAKLGPRSMVGRLVLATVGVLLMIGPPFVFDLLNLTSRFQNLVIAGIELPALAVGLVMLCLGVKEPETSRRAS